MSDAGSFYDPAALSQAALYLVVYDSLLTISKEIESIWQRKLSVVTVLYILQRWVLILDGVLDNLPTPQFWECTQAILGGIFTTLGYLGTAAFSNFRIWAIWEHALGPTLTVALASAVAPAINLYVRSQVIPFAVVDGYCFLTVKYSAATSIRSAPASLSAPLYLFATDRTHYRPSSSVVYISRSFAIATDTLVLVLTWVKTADVWRGSKRIQGIRLVPVMLFLRDGTIYFGIMLTLNIAALILNTTQLDVNATSGFLALLSAVNANLLARFILDLRSVAERESNQSIPLSSINFDIRSLVGNIGAPLEIEDSTWITGPADDVTNGRDKQCEEAELPSHAGM
ncbi:hypothetical protein EIP91_003862 [Steccherinum ochraceum]|uniref:DUF6533 domain-containing protein n=1 Tax=Steccherinum ochraceum TaxID=92696 RepID=A0A4V2MW42_9APHY|nr:hypothetical protein EIP91_003862 [Steccherinum ochraceum]